MFGLRRKTKHQPLPEVEPVVLEHDLYAAVIAANMPKPPAALDPTDESDSDDVVSGPRLVPVDESYSVISPHHSRRSSQQLIEQLAATSLSPSQSQASSPTNATTVSQPPPLLSGAPLVMGPPIPKFVPPAVAKAKDEEKPFAPPALASASISPSMPPLPRGPSIPTPPLVRAASLPPNVIVPPTATAASARPPIPSPPTVSPPPNVRSSRSMSHSQPLPAPRPPPSQSPVPRVALNRSESLNPFDEDVAKSPVTVMSLAIKQPPALRVSRIVANPFDDDDSNSQPAPQPAHNGNPFAGIEVTTCFVALYDYSASAADQLTMEAGGVFSLVDDSHPHWIKLRNASGVAGLVPNTYVRRTESSRSQSPAVQMPIETSRAVMKPALPLAPVKSAIPPTRKPSLSAPSTPPPPPTPSVPTPLPSLAAPPTISASVLTTPALKPPLRPVQSLPPSPSPAPPPVPTTAAVKQAVAPPLPRASSLPTSTPPAASPSPAPSLTPSVGAANAAAFEVCEARHDYAATNIDQLSLVKGEKLLIVDRSNQNWWKVVNGKQRKGLVPITYIRVFHHASSSRGDDNRSHINHNVVSDEVQPSTAISPPLAAVQPSPPSPRAPAPPPATSPARQRSQTPPTHRHSHSQSHSQRTETPSFPQPPVPPSVIRSAPSSPHVSLASPLSMTVAEALYEHRAKDSVQLSCQAGQKLIVVRSEGNGWTLCRDVQSASVGLVPTSYLKCQ